MMKQIKLVICVLIFCFQSGQTKAQTNDLFFSEYIEGSGFNKALELYNGTSLPIDLSAGQYNVQVYFNGSTSSSSMALTGTIATGAVMVIAHPSATLGITPALTNATVLNFNGNDAIVLRKNGVNGTVLDVIGEVGFNPGNQWGSNDTCTLDRSIRRKQQICQGDISLTNVFYVSQQWDGFPLNTFNGLGTHSALCTIGALQLMPTTLNFTSALGVPSFVSSCSLSAVSLSSNVNCTVASPFQLALSSSGPFSSSLTISPSSFTNNQVPIFVRYLPFSVGTQTLSLIASSATSTVSSLLTGLCLSLTTIPQIQGTGTISSYTTSQIATEGVVTGVFQSTNGLGGFFIQDITGDNNPLSSDGIFVSTATITVSAGNLIRLCGTVEEYFNRTQIKSISAFSVTSVNNSITPTPFSLPLLSASVCERYEGMLISSNQTLTVSDVYTLGRFGELVLSNGRLMNPTNSIDPNDAPASGLSYTGTSNVNAVLAQINQNNLNAIILDDGSSIQNPNPVPYLNPSNGTLRSGSTVSGIQGILDFSFSAYRIQPNQSVTINYAARPTVPNVGPCNLKIASMNVLNFFNGDGLGGGFPTPRGASTAAELTRQKTKIVEAMRQLDADVIGIMEMENDGDGPQSALFELVNTLNLATSAGTYTFIADPTFSNGGTGSDEIKIALIYKPARVMPIGLAKADSALVYDRHPLAQTFSLVSNGFRFSLIVNHLKSKSCAGASGVDSDQNDGQSCYNNKRREQAKELLVFADSVRNWSGSPNLVLVGDFNSDEEEDPMDVLRSGGWNHLLNGNYSFVFDAQAGTLDHAFVSDSMFAKLSAAGKWHINADEPVCNDYNQEFNPAYLYSADPFRSSDHDPILLGFEMSNPTPTVTATALSELSENRSLNIVNPFSENNLQVRCFLPINEPVRLSVYDRNANLLYSTVFMSHNGLENLTINAHVPDLIFVKCESGGKNYFFKLTRLKN